MATTFDNSLVKREQLSELIQAFKNLNNIYVFEEQIKALEELYSIEDLIAVG